MYTDEEINSMDLIDINLAIAIINTGIDENKNKQKEAEDNTELSWLQDESKELKDLKKKIMKRKEKLEV